MLADFPSKEVDYSFLQAQLGDKSLPELVIAKRQISRVLLIAFGVSIAVHALLLIIQLRHPRPQAPLEQQARFSIELKQIIHSPPASVPAPEPLTEESAEAAVDEVPVAKPDSPQTAQPVLSASPKPESLKEKSVRLIQPLTREELRELVQSSATERDKGPAPSGDIAANVFHPELRKRLQEEAAKPNLKRVEDDDELETHMDPSGATIVDLGGGKCLRSPATKDGEPKNWFMVACGGKSESEQMMDRVNQEVKARFK